jgi:hypothetical protein
MKKETWRLLYSVIQLIDKSVTIKNVIDNHDGTYSIDSCNTKWLTLKSIFTYSGVDYTVMEIDPNVSMTIKGSAAPLAGTFDISAPFFFHGTIIATGEELHNINSTFDKFPMIFLHEVTEETFDNDEESSIDRTSDCSLYFMVDSNIQDWKTDLHYKYAIRPMRNLLFELIEVLNNNKGIGEFDNYRVADHARWGVYIIDKGHTKQIFKDNLSGTSLKINIPFLKNLICTACS